MWAVKGSVKLALSGIIFLGFCSAQSHVHDCDPKLEFWPVDAVGF